MEQQKKEPRALEDINKEYNQLCLKAGDLQYRIKCFGGELENINHALLQVNQEAAKRKELDDAAKLTVVPTTNDEQSMQGNLA